MDLHPKQFVRVNVKAAAGHGVERMFERTFSVDPRTITLDRLRHLIARALNIRDEFSMVALRRESDLPLSCDWDLEGALSDEPNMDLLLQLKPNEPGLEEWDIICPADVPVAGHETSVPKRRRNGSLLEQIFSRVMAPPSPSRAPLSESEFEALSDWPCPLRYAVYRTGAAEAGVRPRLWMHLLDVYPTGAGRHEREEFLNRKCEEYYRLRHGWQRLVRAGTVPSILQEVTSLIRKDVRRTDRVQGLDERALYNVLTTYAVHHPPVGYCQGMSDLLSPLLHVMGSEARAYLAFCALMRRMHQNFRPDGRSVCAKFRHLRRAIRAHDPHLHEHLRGVGALDLLFCYRWLLLDLKREFPYDEMLQLQEVLWSTFRPIASDKGVELYEEPFPAPSVWEEKEVEPRLLFADNHFGTSKRTDPPTLDTLTSLKRWAILSRRQSIARNIEESSSSSTEDEDGGIVHYYRHYRRSKRRRRRTACRSWSGRDSSLRSPCFYSNTVHDIRIDSWIKEDMSSVRRRHGSSDSNYESNLSEEEEDEESPSRGRSEGYTSGQGFEDEDSSLNSFDSADTYFNSQRTRTLLPPPTRLGDGKPFLIFLCLTMILGHRDAILGQRMDANEIGMYFDRHVRGHRLSEVLPAAKALFEEYLRSGWTEED